MAPRQIWQPRSCSVKLDSANHGPVFHSKFRVKTKVSDTIEPHIPSTFGGPAWEVAKLFPPQGQWSESDFFRIHTNQMAELVNGTLEILPMPNWLHQLIVIFLLDCLRDYLKQKQLGGSELTAEWGAKRGRDGRPLLARWRF